jgi:hypothetical protein
MDKFLIYELIEMVKINGLILKNIKTKQTEEMCQLAVIQNPDAFKYAKIHNKKMCCIAIHASEENIIYEHDSELILYMLSCCGNALQYIKSPTEEQSLVAIKQTVNSIRYALQNEKVCTLALDVCTNSFKYFTYQNASLACRAVMCNPINIVYVHREINTESLCILAVMRMPDLLQYIPREFHTKPVCLAAIYKDWTAVRHVAMMTHEIAMEAIKINVEASKYIPMSEYIREYIKNTYY